VKEKYTMNGMGCLVYKISLHQDGRIHGVTHHGIKIATISGGIEERSLEH
jgi:hypothetical protein